MSIKTPKEKLIALPVTVQVDEEDSVAYALDARGGQVAECASVQHAYQIARALNCFDDMRKVCAALKRWDDADDPSISDETSFEVLCEVCELARAVLAKAEAQQ